MFCDVYLVQPIQIWSMFHGCRPTTNLLLPVTPLSLSLSICFAGRLFRQYMKNMHSYIVCCVVLVSSNVLAPTTTTSTIHTLCQKIPQTYLLPEKILIRLNCLKPYKHSEVCINRQRLICICVYGYALEIVAFVKLNVPAHSQT